MLDEGSSAALHSPITLGTCPSSPLPLIHLSSSSGSQSKARWTEMGREHPTPWKGHVWMITKADPWGNQTHRRERPSVFGFPKQPHLPVWLSSGSMSSTHGEVLPRLAQHHLHYRNVQLLGLPGMQNNHVATPQGVLNAADPHQESLWVPWRGAVGLPCTGGYFPAPWFAGVHDVLHLLRHHEL